MPSFFTRHPYYKNLIKFAGYIVVGYNTLVICMFLPMFAFMVMMMAMAAAFSGGESASSDVPTSYSSVYGNGANQLLSIKVNGIIMGQNDEETSWFNSLSGATYGYDVKDQLIAAADDDSIKGVILEIDSPGGTIYGSHAIADGVKYYREQTKRPVYAHVSGMGASGAYWAAVSTDKILADYGSDVGSVGVIMGPFEYYDKVVATDGGLLGGGVVTQNGVQHFNITAGKSKDAGDPYRKLTNEELAIFQGQVNNEYDNFVAYVSERRNIPVETIKGQIGALTYDNKTAINLKLIDGTANRDDAYDELAKAAKVEDDYSIVRESSASGFWSSVFSSVTSLFQPKAQAPANNATAATAAFNTKVCGITKSTMAYYGDVAALCQ